jgi:hypothetical protein
MQECTLRGTTWATRRAWVFQFVFRVWAWWRAHLSEQHQPSRGLIFRGFVQILSGTPCDLQPFLAMRGEALALMAGRNGWTMWLGRQWTLVCVCVCVCNSPREFGPSIGQCIHRTIYRRSSTSAGKVSGVEGILPHIPNYGAWRLDDSLQTVNASFAQKGRQGNAKAQSSVCRHEEVPCWLSHELVQVIHCITRGEVYEMIAPEIDIRERIERECGQSKLVHVWGKIIGAVQDNDGKIPVRIECYIYQVIQNRV